MSGRDSQSAAAGKKRAWIVIGLLGAAVLAVLGGKILGDHVSIAGDSGDNRPRAVTPIDPAEPESPPQAIALPDITESLLPQIAVGTRIAPGTMRVPLVPESWVRQQDFPRQMFGDQEVSGVIAASLTVAVDGSVTRCALGASSQIDPQSMLRATGTSICRALQARARFEPLAELIADPSLEDLPGHEKDKQAQVGISPGDAVARAPHTPNGATQGRTDEISVRVIFRTANKDRGQN